jgi:hypothetical protein
LKLHAARDVFYAVLFGTLPILEWRGGCAYALVAVLGAEIILTLWDFVVEIAVRKPFGDVYAGERVTHAVMAIIYGAMLAHLLPVIDVWRRESTALTPHTSPTPPELVWLLTLMAVGVTASGLRDAYAALGLPGGEWPWRAEVEG